LSSKGLEAERQLIRYLEHRGYQVIHSAGSRGPMDIIAHRKKFLEKKRFGIQVKATRKSEINVEKNEIEALRRIANNAGFEPVLAVRFGRENWKVWLDSEEDFPFEEADFTYLLNKYKSQPTILLRADDPKAKFLEKVFSQR